MKNTEDERQTLWKGVKALVIVLIFVSIVALKIFPKREHIYGSVNFRLFIIACQTHLLLVKGLPFLRF